MIDDIFSEVKKIGLPPESYVVVGGGVLAAYGIRETQDIDIVVLPEIFMLLQSQGFELDPVYEGKWGRLRLKKDGVEIYPDFYSDHEQRFIDIEDLIDSAVIINDIAFMSFERLRSCKQSSSREKDLQDLKLIDMYLSSNK